jgi:hypothetical protein
MSRTFEATEAARAAVPVWFGLFGASGSGKTCSALRIATGIQRVAGGAIYVIDTEGKRALHYAPKAAGARESGTFNFRHIDLRAPFGSLDYLEAVEYAHGHGARVIVIDSMTHEHDGEGGYIDLHEAEKERLAAAWKTSEEKAQWTAWQEPKRRRRRAIDRMIQLGIHFVFCFRAEDKTKPPPKGQRDAVHLGDQPVGGKAWVFEMTACALLRPGSRGVPTWIGSEPAENLMIKRPGYLSVVTEREGALDEQTGELLARWAGGGDALTPEAAAPPKRAPSGSPYAAVKRDLLAATDRDALDKPGRAIRDQRVALTDEQRAELLPILAEREAVLLPRAEQAPNPDQDGR